ncbi:MAG: hypothetical protein HYT76_07945 [Deltaproteobacteria bacterium]|nr:hypothetical protein [Deltaproteobacteria bacterium]
MRSVISRLLVVMLVLGLSVGCLEQTQRGGGTETGSTNPGNEEDTSDGDSDGTTANGFHVKGQISAQGLALESGDSQALAVSEEVTDVYLANPETGNVSCKTVEVEKDGTFDAKITAQNFWSVFFINRYRIGREMFLGRFRSSTTDAIVANKDEGELDLGTVTIDTDAGEAASDQDHEEILQGLGLESDTAEDLGDLDDLASRYSNPDVDGDGELDCGQTDHDFRLDFHVRFNTYENSKRVTVADLIDRFVDETKLTTEYDMTGVYVGYQKSFSSASKGSVTFVNSSVTTSEGGSIPAGKQTSAVTSSPYANYNQYGPNIVNTSELPSGEIVFSFGGKELTFTNVKTPTLAELKAPIGRIFPLIRFNKKDSSCQTDCTLSSISYKWMKKTAEGWTAASETELKLLVDDDGGFISFYINNDSSRAVGFTIPSSALSGDIEWKVSQATGSLSQSELDQVKTTQICHFAVSYDDKLGMRYFPGIDEASGTCGK